MGGQVAPVLSARVLAATIRMVEQALRRLAHHQRLREGGDGELPVQSLPHRPADDLP